MSKPLDICDILWLDWLTKVLQLGNLARFTAVLHASRKKTYALAASSYCLLK